MKSLKGKKISITAEMPETRSSEKMDEMCYVLMIDGKPVKTKNRKVRVSHRSRRLMDQLVAELDLCDILDEEVMGLYRMVCSVIDFYPYDLSNDNLAEMLEADCFLSLCAGPESQFQLERQQVARTYFAKVGINLPVLPLQENCNLDSMRQLGDNINCIEFVKLVDYLFSEFRNMTGEQQAVFVNAVNCDESCTLAMLLAMRVIEPLEYATMLASATAIDHKVFGSGSENERKDFSIDKEDLVRRAEILARFLTLSESFNQTKYNLAETLLKKGESVDLEFKSTLRKNLVQNKVDKEMEHAVMKTICAFMNSYGGTLLIGVDDSGNVIGIENDEFPNFDKFQLHFTNLFRSHIGIEFNKYVNWEIISFDSHHIFKVDCKKSSEPVVLKGGEEMYIRTGPSSVRLSVKQAIDYVKRNF